MFESRHRFLFPPAWALQSPALDTGHADCWAGLKDPFKP
jgi:homogentisate 1,2-dioxygenase